MHNESGSIYSCAPNAFGIVGISARSVYEQLQDNCKKAKITLSIVNVDRFNKETKPTKKVPKK